MRKFIHPSEDPDAYDLYQLVHNERVRAHEKHDDGGASMERKSWDDEAWLSVLTEELGEVARVLCEKRHGSYPNPWAMANDLRDELIQLAAMSVAWVAAIHNEDGPMAAWPEPTCPRCLNSGTVPASDHGSDGFDPCPECVETDQ